MDAPTQLLTVVLTPFVVCVVAAVLVLAFQKTKKTTQKLWVNPRCANCKTNLCWSCTPEGTREHQAYSWSAEPK
ncbi:hypothetical protein [Corallincola spongiicola]|uniref:FeoB-associated Cys-rich membrane protein n=1 Tax=Corallincola spongiicola TaxID=2520508 RepID=A0ABY1WR67_9GAMM|nr:hypothetical protein [Corallincola spongiicola]TAA47213.1 hypothetical protein EXY25_08205 [Corallincola spongiicola]